MSIDSAGCGIIRRSENYCAARLLSFVDLPARGHLRCRNHAGPESLIGQTISHYRIVERLGGGGMGVVFKAHRPEQIPLRNFTMSRVAGSNTISEAAISPDGRYLLSVKTEKGKQSLWLLILAAVAGIAVGASQACVFSQFVLDSGLRNSLSAAH